MTKNIMIHGETFEVTTPYTEGQPLGAAEAKSLNQTRAENIANNFRKKVKDAQTNGTDLGAVRAEFAEYDGKYTFSMGGGGAPRVVMDPVEREARSIARNAIKTKLAADGKKLKQIDPDKLEAAIVALIARADIVKAAKKRIAEVKQAAEVSLEDIGLQAA